MSTRALIHIYEDLEDETPLTTIYKHFDGYPTKHGVGETLADYVMDSHIVSGLPLNPTDHMHNGMGCFAASLIKHLKEGAGDVYISKPGAEDQFEDYIYTIAPTGVDKDRLFLMVRKTSDESQEILVPG